MSDYVTLPKIVKERVDSDESFEKYVKKETFIWAPLPYLNDPKIHSSN